MVELPVLQELEHLGISWTLAQAVCEEDASSRSAGTVAEWDRVVCEYGVPIRLAYGERAVRLRG